MVLVILGYEFGAGRAPLVGRSIAQHPRIMTRSPDQDPGSTTAIDSESNEFETVAWDSLEGGTRLVWLRPLVAVLLVALLVGGAGHTIRHETDLVPVAGVGIDVLDWMYGLALLVVGVIVVPAAASAPERTRRLLGRVRNHPIVAVCGCYLLLLLLVGSVYPLVVPEPRFRLLLSLQPPVWGEIAAGYVPTCHGPVIDGQCQGTFDHPLGTSPTGSDLLRVSLYGLNTSLQVAVTATVLAVAAGVLVGTVAGYVGGWTDELLMRYVDVQRSVPSFFVYVLLILLFARSYQLLILVFGLLSWGGIARLVRSEVVQRRTEPYVAAAELSGASTPSVVVRHVLPNVSNTIVTAATVLFAKLVVYEASLSFLSLTDSSVVSLGNQISFAIGRESADVTTPATPPLWDWTLLPWIVLVPVGLLCSLLLAVGVLGDGFRDVLDPRS